MPESKGTGWTPIPGEGSSGKGPGVGSGATGFRLGAVDSVRAGRRHRAVWGKGGGTTGRDHE